MKRLMIGLMLCLSASAFGMQKVAVRAARPSSLIARSFAAKSKSEEADRRIDLLESARAAIDDANFDLYQGNVLFGTAIYYLKQADVLSGPYHKKLLDLEASMQRLQLNFYREFGCMRKLIDDEVAKEEEVKKD